MPMPPGRWRASRGDRPAQPARCPLVNERVAPSLAAILLQDAEQTHERAVCHSGTRSDCFPLYRTPCALANVAAHAWHPKALPRSLLPCASLSVAPKALGQLGCGELVHQIAKLKHVVQPVGDGAVCQAGGQIVLP